ncbi:hypothetical protein D9M69_571210 [compost metagenome]
MLSSPSSRRGSTRAPTRASFSRAWEIMARRSSAPNRVTGSRPRARFSATVIAGTVFSSWWMMAMPWDTASCGERMSISLPSIRMRPESRATFPARIFISVDFPAPFSPIRACTSPARRSNWTLFSARVAAKRFVMPSSCSSGWGEGVVVMVAYFRSGCVGLREFSGPTQGWWSVTSPCIG